MITLRRISCHGFGEEIKTELIWEIKNDNTALYTITDLEEEMKYTNTVCMCFLDLEKTYDFILWRLL